MYDKNDNHYQKGNTMKKRILIAASVAAIAATAVAELIGPARINTQTTLGTVTQPFDNSATVVDGIDLGDVLPVVSTGTIRHVSDLVTNVMTITTAAGRMSSNLAWTVYQGQSVIVTIGTNTGAKVRFRNTVYN